MGHRFFARFFVQKNGFKEKVVALKIWPSSFTYWKNLSITSCLDIF